MGKQAKPKPANQKGTQRKHNPLTRGINTKKATPLWDWSILFDALEERLPDGTTRTTFHPKSSEEAQRYKDTPLEDLFLDWETEIQHFAVNSGGKIERLVLPTGGTRYTVYNEYAGPGTQIIRRNLLVVETPRGFVNFGPKKNGKQRRGQRNKEEAAPTPSR